MTQLDLYVSERRCYFVSEKSVQATNGDWAELTGKFLINSSPAKVIAYFEGPPAGVDILVNYLTVKHAEKKPPSLPPSFEVSNLEAEKQCVVFVTVLLKNQTVGSTESNISFFIRYLKMVLIDSIMFLRIQSME